MKKCLLPCICMLLLISTVTGQVLQQVADINTAGSSNPWQLAVCNNKLFFVASGNNNGLRAIYATQGTAATTVALTAPRQISLDLFPVAYKNKLYFSYDDGTNGQELWVSDGTPAGTKLFMDIYPGSTSAYPLALTVANNTLFFIANNTAGERRLFATDGSTAGTKVLVNDNVNWFNGDGRLGVYNNEAYFIGFNYATYTYGLWKSNGTATQVVKDNVVPSAGGSAEMNGKLYLSMTDDTYGNELWVTDGTTSGTQLVKDIGAGTGFNSNPQSFATFNNKVYFSADDGVHGQEIWATDGTTNGTALVKDVVPGADGSQPYASYVYNNRIYFSCWAPDQLWVSDGTATGTQLVATIPDAAKFAATWNNTMYLISGSSNAIYQSDGTAAGTHALHIDNSASQVYRNYQAASDQYFATYNNELYFQASSSGITTGFELVKLTLPGDNTWTGITSSDWNTASNWSAQTVPNATANVIVPAGTPYSIVITAAQEVSCKSMKVSAGATVTVGTGGKITVVQ